MTDRPILFSGPMVRALLEGRKTQTRRVLKLPKKTASGGAIYEHKDMGGWEPTVNGGGGTFIIVKDGARIPAPETVGAWHRTTGVCMNAPFQAGDRLYVREAWRTFDGAGMDDDKAPRDLDPQIVWYEAHGTAPEEINAGKFRQGMHMPRWASRLTLTVSDVRVQRLQEISEVDAIAEGMTQAIADTIMGPEELAVFASTHILCPEARARILYETLWDHLNAARGFGWSTNPWVVAVSFAVHLGNIDQIGNQP